MRGKAFIAYGANSLKKSPQQQQIALTANHDPSVCNAVSKISTQCRVKVPLVKGLLSLIVVSLIVLVVRAGKLKKLFRYNQAMGGRARITNFEGHSISRPQQKGTYKATVLKNTIEV